MSSQISASAGLHTLSNYATDLSSLQTAFSKLDSSGLSLNSKMSSEGKNNYLSVPCPVPPKATATFSHGVDQILASGINGKIDGAVSICQTQIINGPIFMQDSTQQNHANIFHLPPYSDATIPSHMMDPAKSFMLPPPVQLNFGTPMSIPTPRLPTPRHRTADRSPTEPVPQLSSLLLAAGLVGTTRPTSDSGDQMGHQLSLKAAANLCRYKSELCRPFIEHGQCKYGDKCQFAHGRHEIRSMIRHPKYKTDLCKTYHTTGLCPYGPRCHFIHNDEERKLSDLNRQLIDQQRARLVQLQQRQQQQIQLSVQIRELQRRMAIADALATVSRLSAGTASQDPSSPTGLTSGLNLPGGNVISDISRKSEQDLIVRATGIGERSALPSESMPTSPLAYFQNAEFGNLSATKGVFEFVPGSYTSASPICKENGQYITPGEDLYQDSKIKRDGAMSGSELENLTANLKNLQLQVQKLEEADRHMTLNGNFEKSLQDCAKQGEYTGIGNKQENMKDILSASYESMNTKLMPNADAHLAAINNGYHYQSDRFVSSWNSNLAALPTNWQPKAVTNYVDSVANNNQVSIEYPTRVNLTNKLIAGMIGESENGLAETERKVKSELHGNNNGPESLESSNGPTDDIKSDQSFAGDINSATQNYGMSLIKRKIQGQNMNTEEIFSLMDNSSNQKSSSISSSSLPLTSTESSAGTRLSLSLSSSPSISSPSLSEVETSSSHDRPTSEASVPESFATWMWNDHSSNWTSSSTIGAGPAGSGWRTCLVPSSNESIIQTAPVSASIRQPWSIY